MAFKTRYVLGLKKYNPTATDPYGSPVDAWADPVDWPVFGYAPGQNIEPELDARSESDILWTIYAPVDGLPGERDLVVLDGDEYAIEGRPRDYSHSPFGGDIGQGVVYLKRVEG